MTVMQKTTTRDTVFKDPKYRIGNSVSSNFFNTSHLVAFIPSIMKSLFPKMKIAGTFTIALTIIAIVQNLPHCAMVN